MVNALHAASSGMQAQFEQIQNIANNVANANTTGYKRTRAEFQDLLYETLQEPGANTSALTQAPVGIQRGMGVQVSGTQRYFEMGAPQRTDRDLDVMIKGDGFFVVQLPNGELAYRKDGSFHKSATGRIETVDGYPLQPEIMIPTNALKINISEDGIVQVTLANQEQTQIGQFQLATFVNNGGLKAIGKNLFAATEASGPANVSVPMEGTTGGLLQGHLESSNVDVIKEMTDMISAQRTFELNSRVVQSVDQMLQHTSNLK